MPLGLQAILFQQDGSAYPDGPGSVVIQYAVTGLPKAMQALIRKRDSHWETLLVENDVPGVWRGDHQTPHTALAAVEAAIVGSRRSRQPRKDELGGSQP